MDTEAPERNPGCGGHQGPEIFLTPLKDDFPRTVVEV